MASIFSTSHRLLKIISALVWVSGGFVLIAKGSELLLEAISLQPDNYWNWLSPILGIGIGVLKVRFIFGPSCKRNLNRISQLPDPKVWQCFRPGFIAFLFAMIILGSTLSHMSHGNYPFLIGMVILDYSLTIALFGSSYVFWQQRIFSLNPKQ